MIGRGVRRSIVRSNKLGKRFSSGHHETPLAPEEDILKNPVLRAAIAGLGFMGFFAWHGHYKRNHGGNSVFSFLDKSMESDDLVSSLKQYQERVREEVKLNEMIQFRPKRDIYHYSLNIDGVPGKYFSTNSTGNVSQHKLDFDTLEERRKPVDVFDR